MSARRPLPSRGFENHVGSNRAELRCGWTAFFRRLGEIPSQRPLETPVFVINQVAGCSHIGRLENTYWLGSLRCLLRRPSNEMLILSCRSVKLDVHLPGGRHLALDQPPISIRLLSSARRHSTTRLCVLVAQAVRHLAERFWARQAIGNDLGFQLLAFPAFQTARLPRRLVPQLQIRQRCAFARSFRGHAQI
jgi:hypothetical protein